MMREKPDNCSTCSLGLNWQGKWVPKGNHAKEEGESCLRLSALVEKLPLKQCGSTSPAGEVKGGYCSDLLSDVMGRATARSIWVTSQIHPNVVAVASLIDAAAVVIAGGLEPEEETVNRADEMGIPVFKTKLPSFEIVGRLYQLGVRGTVKDG